MTSCLRRARRISAISFTVRPRYSETISVRLRRERLSQLGDRLALGLCRHQALLVLARNRRAAVGQRRPKTSKPLRRRLVGWPDLAGALPTREGGRHMSLPRRARRRPRSPIARRSIRSGGSSPDRHDPEGRIGPRAQAVSGGSVFFSCGDALAPIGRRAVAAYGRRPEPRCRAAGQAAAAAASTAGRSTRMPGPIVLAIVRPRR